MHCSLRRAQGRGSIRQRPLVAVVETIANSYLPVDSSLYQDCSCSKYLEFLIVERFVETKKVRCVRDPKLQLQCQSEPPAHAHTLPTEIGVPSSNKMFIAFVAVVVVGCRHVPFSEQIGIKYICTRAFFPSPYCRSVSGGVSLLSEVQK